jgi:hypothetical protein
MTVTRIQSVCSREIARPGQDDSFLDPGSKREGRGGPSLLSVETLACAIVEGQIERFSGLSVRSSVAASMTPLFDLSANQTKSPAELD